MSLSYRLLRKPKTLDEFIDKMNKKGIKEIEVVVKAYDALSGFGMGGMGLGQHRCAVGVMANGDILKLNEYVHQRMGDLFTTVVSKTVAQKDAVKEGIEIAEKLVKLGFKATINKKTIAETKKITKEYSKAIKKTRRKTWSVRRFRQRNECIV